MEGIEGVRLPGGELRDPYDWTTEELLRDFEEFLGDAFKIAHILDGSPYWTKAYQLTLILLLNSVVLY